VNILLPFGVGDDYFLEMSETELLHAFRKERSEEAFAELVRRYASLVYSVAKRRLFNPALAEDVTQIVFIRFAKAPPKVDSHSELAAWLHRTTVNVTIDTWRSETRRFNREQQAAIMEPAEENAKWEEIAPNLDEALNELEEVDRRALLLRFFNRKTMRDVGAALGVSEDAAKMRVSRAVDRLRTRLGVRGVACTTAVLGALITENSMEAAPKEMISKVATIRLPVGMGATAGWFGGLLRPSILNLGVSAAVLVLVGVTIAQFLRSSAAQSSEVSRSQPDSVAAPTEGPERPKIQIEDSNIPKVLAKAAKIRLHVLDSETGIGLAGAQIQIAYFGAGGQGEGHETLTDGIGDADIAEPDNPTRNHGPNVFVTAEGHVPKAIAFGGGRGTPLPAEYTLKLDPAMTAGGIVVDEQRALVAGVAIWIEGPGAKHDQIEDIDFQTCPVTNRDDGTWNCSYIPKDWEEIRFILKKPGYAVTFPIVPVKMVNLTNLVLVIDRGRAITGRIVDRQKNPIANARVNILDGNPSKRQSTRTDENGFFILSGVAGAAQRLVGYEQPPVETNDNGSVIIRGLVPSGFPQADLAIQAKGFSSQTSAVELVGETNVANFTLLSGNVFRGRVVDQAGHPIPYAVVQTDYNFASQVHKKFDWTTHTDRSGRFEWDSAPADEVTYWFEADGYEVIRGLPLRADGQEHEITLRTRAPN
jgi:RNA polymerase sigma factor (sigma-70 family)